MGKIVRDEDLRLNIIVNGDPARRKIGDLTREVRDLSNENRVLRQEQSRLRATGQQNTAQYKSLTKQIKENLAIIKRNKAELNSMRSTMAINCMTMDDLSRRATSLRVALRNTVPGTAAWQELADQLKAVTRRQEELKAISKETGLTLGNVANGINRYIGLITAGFASLAIVKQIVGKVRGEYLQYDEALTRASRTTNLTKEEVRELSDELATLDTRTAQNELIDLIGLAGKLGLSGEEDILGFVTAADMINVALSEDLGGNAEDALREIGKLVDIFKLKGEYGMEESMLKIGSTINSLGMASTANEGYIVDFAKQIAGMSQTVGMTAPQVLGLGATLDSLGQRGETAATALTNVIADISKNAEQYAKVAGVSLQEFTQLLETDVNEALLLVLEGIGQGSSADTIKLLDSLGLSGSRATTILGSLSQNVDTIRKQQELANQAFLDATSIKEEFNRMNSSATAIMEKAKKDVIEEARLLGEQLNPMITTSLSLTTHGIRLFSSIIGFATKYKAVIAGLAIVVGAYNLVKKTQIALEKLSEFYSKRNMVLLRQRARDLAALRAAEMAVSKSSALLCTVQNLLVFNFKAAGLAAKTLIASMGPLGWAFTAIGVVVGTATTAMAVMANRSKTLTDISKKASEVTDEEGTSLVGKAEKMKHLMSVIESTTTSEEQRNAAIKELQALMPNGINLINQETIANGKAAEAVKKHTQALIAEATLKAALQKKDEILKKVGEDKLAGKDRKVSFWKQMGISMAVAESNGALSYSEMMAAAQEAAAKKYEEKTAKQLAEVDKVAEKYRKELQGIVGDSSTNTDTPTSPTTTTPTVSPRGGDNYGQKWSLNSDEEFLQKRLALKKEYQNSETMTQEEYNAKLLQLEIDALTARLKTNADSGADRVALEEDLADKLIQQKERINKGVEQAEKENERLEEEWTKSIEDEARKREKIEMDIAEMSGDRIAIEKAKYEKLKREYAGNARALEALERAHKARLAKIQLEALDKTVDARRDAYEVARMQMLNRHRQEMETFSGSERARREKRKEHWAELNALDEKYLNEMIATLTNLVDNAQVGDIKIGVELSDADKAKLLKEIEDLRQQLDKLKNTSNKTEIANSVGEGSFLGLSQSDWEDMFSGNLGGWQEWASSIATVVGAVGEQVMSLWGKVNDYMAAKEKAALKEYEKNNNKKKTALEKRLNAGLITEAQYNAEVEAMDAEYEAYQEELALKQAKRQKAMNLTQAIINTALGVTMTLAQWGIPWGLIPAGIMAAMGAAEIALIAATPITTGAEDGGPIGNGTIDVRREQDGKPFRARLNPNKRGFVSSPTVLVAENGTEYVLPNEVVQNPTAYPLLSAVETARQHGTLSSLDFSAIYSPYSVAGRAPGGYIGDTPRTTMSSSQTTDDSGEVKALLLRVLTVLSKPLDARVVMLGRNGIVENLEKYNKQKSRGKIGG